MNPYWKTELRISNILLTCSSLGTESGKKMGRILFFNLLKSSNFTYMGEYIYIYIFFFIYNLPCRQPRRKSYIYIISNIKISYSMQLQNCFFFIFLLCVELFLPQTEFPMQTILPLFFLNLPFMSEFKTMSRNS